MYVDPVKLIINIILYYYVILLIINISIASSKRRKEVRTAGNSSTKHESAWSLIFMAVSFSGDLTQGLYLDYFVLLQAEIHQDRL